MKGVRTRKQALAEGHSPKAIREALRRGRWQRPFRGIYVTHSGNIRWRERLYAAVLAAGDRAAASGDCALNLWGLSKDEPSFLTIDIPVERVVRGRLPGVRVRRRRRHTRAVQKKVPVLGLHQTVIDAIASPRRTIDDIVILLAKACAPGKSSPAALRAELAHHPNHPRRSLLAEILEAADLGLESGAEWRYITAVERAHGLPAMTPQAPLEGPAPQERATPDVQPAAQSGEANNVQPTAGTQPGDAIDPEPIAGTEQNEPSGTASRAGRQSAAAARRRKRLDFLDEERDIGLEIDGEMYHRESFRTDRSRDRKSAGRGRIILRACFVDVVVTPCELAADVAVVQISRGWKGRPYPCSAGCPLPTDPRLQSVA